MSFGNYQDYISQTQIEIGTKIRHLVDAETGEKIDVHQLIKRVYNQKLFWKVTLSDFLGVLGIIESKQLDVVIHILENTRPSSNTYMGSRKKIAQRTGVSLDTVGRIMKKLLDLKFLKMVQPGVYQVSPKIMMRGSEAKRQVLLSYYDESPKKTEEITRQPIIQVGDDEWVAVSQL